MHECTISAVGHKNISDANPADWVTWNCKHMVSTKPFQTTVPEVSDSTENEPQIKHEMFNSVLSSG